MSTQSPKQHFLYRLNGPRPDFATTMSEAERAGMQEHSRYWAGLTDRGTCLVYGPVFDPAGSWGLAIVEVESEAEAHDLGTNDPVVRSGLCTFALVPMRANIKQG